MKAAIAGRRARMIQLCRVAILAFFALVSGCSADAAKRTTYETLQSIRERECMKTPSQDCKKRETYEDYRRQLDSLGPVE